MGARSSFAHITACLVSLFMMHMNHVFADASLFPILIAQGSAQGSGTKNVQALVIAITTTYKLHIICWVLKYLEFVRTALQRKYCYSYFTNKGCEAQRG